MSNTNAIDMEPRRSRKLPRLSDLHLRRRGRAGVILAHNSREEALELHHWNRLLVLHRAGCMISDPDTFLHMRRAIFMQIRMNERSCSVGLC
jgi:hypothetical protein